jgi:hypothetical protein
LGSDTGPVLQPAPAPTLLVAVNIQGFVDSTSKLVTRGFQNLESVPTALQRQASRARDSILLNASTIRSLASSNPTTNAWKLLQHVKDNVEELIHEHIEPVAVGSVGRLRRYLSLLTDKYAHPRSLTYSLTHSLTHLLTYSLTHSLTYSLTQSLTQGTTRQQSRSSPITAVRGAEPSSSVIQVDVSIFCG